MSDRASVNFALHCLLGDGSLEIWSLPIMPLLVDGEEEAGVLAHGADILVVEKLARYFIRTSKDNQLGKKCANIKETVRTDLQALIEYGIRQELIYLGKINWR